MKDLDDLLEANNYEVPISYSSFQTLFHRVGKVPQPLMDPLPEFPPLPDLKPLSNRYEAIPTLSELGYEKKNHTTFFKGGEREALKKMTAFLSDRANTASFEKPKTIPTSIKPDTTALSPYIRYFPN